MTKIEELKNKAVNGVYTHGGIFHADDVFASALLMLAGICSVEDIQRIRNVTEIENENPDASLVFDIGGGQFDHHQQDARFRENGNKYAAFGLIWDYIGKEVIEEFSDCYDKKIINKAFDKVDKEFVTPIDLTDNYGQLEYPNPISYWINTANKTEDGFVKSVEIAYKILEDVLNASLIDASTYVEAEDRLSKIGNSNVIFNEGKFIPMKIITEINDNIKCLISPSPRGGYNLMVSPGIVIPEEVKKIDGFTFRHAAGFLASFETVEGAKEAAKLVVDKTIMAVI